MTVKREQGFLTGLFPVRQEEQVSLGHAGVPESKSHCIPPSAGPALTPDLPRPFSPPTGEHEPFLLIHLSDWILSGGWLSQRVRNLPFVPTTWHPGFRLCAVLTFSIKPLMGVKKKIVSFL